MGRRVGIAGAALLAVALLVGCGNSEAQGPPAVSPEEATAEFRAEAADLVLPPGAEWPAEPVQDTAEDGAGNIFQPGYGRVHADHVWLCAWEGRVLQTKGAARRPALKTLMGYKLLYAYTDADAPETVAATDQLLERALLGDFGPLQQDYELNCADVTDAG